MGELFRRRVPHIVGAYFAGAWILVEFTDWAVDRYALAPTLTDFVVTSLALLLPMIAILAWRHGAPGHDGWTAVDGLVIGLNLIAAAGVLFSLFGGRELGAATTVRLLEDDAGNTVERVIPKAEFRRDVLLWDFDNPSGDAELDWLRSGLWMALGQDLSQDLFVTPVDPTDERVSAPLRAAGFDAPYGIPLALKREAAGARGVGHFLEGELLDRTGDTLVVRTRLYETRNGRQIAEHTYRGTAPLEMVDQMSLDVRRDLGIPDWQIEGSVDLPIAEIFTKSPEAFRAFSGYRPALIENRLADAKVAADSAVAVDSTFAAAHGASASASLLMGDQAAAREGIAKAQQYSYRLPERSRLLIQMLDRMLFRTDPEGAIQTGNYWTELYPQDPMARQLLAQVHANQGDFEGTIAQFKALLAIDPTNIAAHQAIGATYGVLEEYDSALAYYGRLAELQPNDVQTRLDVAATQANRLEFDAARAELERARVAGPEDPAVLERQARLEMRLGDYGAAGRRIDEMEALARTPQQREQLAAVEESFFDALGRWDGLHDAYGRRVIALAEFQPPIASVQLVPRSEALINAADWGREAFALSQIDSLRSSVEEPWSLVPEVAALQVHLDVGDVEAARESLARLEVLDRTFGTAPGRQARIRWGEARIAEIEDGDCRRAVDLYELATELSPLSPRYRAWFASCLASLERWDEAEAEVKWLLDRLPGDPKLRVLAARLAADRGRTAEAIAELETALETWSGADPGFRPAQEARALLEELRAGG